MASSGTLNGNHVSDGNEYAYLSWSVGAQEVDNNRSRIDWVAGWHFTTYSCRGLRNGSAYINGVNVWLNNAAGDGVHQFNSGHDHRPALAVASGSFWVGHNADGTKSVALSVGLTGFSGQVSNGSTTVSLPTIPRFSSPPSKPVISGLTSTQMTVTFSDGTGGATIDSRQIGYGTNSSSPTTIISSDGSTTISGLTPGTKYYIWARTHNAAGYSDWSPRADATTWKVPDSFPLALSETTQVSVKVTFTAGFNGGTPITGYDVAYNTVNSTTGATIISATSPQVITGLNPGVKYWFYVRAKNAVGNGPWSSGAAITTIAGAWIEVTPGVYKKAIPYVKVAGVWKIARPWVKALGTWKESI